MSHSDPIAGAASRFALDNPGGSLTISHEAPSTTGLRPFALRFARAFDDVAGRVAVVPRYQYCNERQIAILADGSDVPLFKHTNPRTQETTGTSDGERPTEETRNDWQKG